MFYSLLPSYLAGSFPPFWPFRFFVVGGVFGAHSVGAEGVEKRELRVCVCVCVVGEVYRFSIYNPTPLKDKIEEHLFIEASLHPECFYATRQQKKLKKGLTHTHTHTHIRTHSLSHSCAPCTARAVCGVFFPRGEKGKRSQSRVSRRRRRHRRQQSNNSCVCVCVRESFALRGRK